ncbi:MAG: hypothetical protein OXG23_15850 [Chloroflexi bacterium]|nr:hypothetical protein [Chloroflexota bacterium]
MNQPLPPRRSTAPCLVALTSLLIAAALVGLSLFLPPINLPDRLLAAQYSPLNAASPAIALGAEFRLSLPPAEPSADFAVKLARLPAEEFESAAADRSPWLSAARDALPSFLTLRSPLYHIESRGGAPSTLNLELQPGAAEMPTNRLSLYGWTGDSWRFIPSEPAAGVLYGAADFAPRAIAAFAIIPSAPILLIAQEISEDLDADIAELATILSPAGLRPTANGGLIGSLAPGGGADAPYLFMPLIRNFADPRALDITTIDALIADPRLRAEHSARITDLVLYNQFDGVFIDYRGLSPEHRADFARLIVELSQSFAPHDLRLGVVVSAEPGADGAWESGAYDWRRLGAAADYIQLRAIINPSAYLPQGAASVADLLRQLTAEVARNKVLLGLSVRSVREVDGVQRRIGWHDAFAALGDVIVTAAEVSQTGSIEPGALIHASLSGYTARAGLERDIQTAYIDYHDESAAAISRIWLTDSAALRHRLESVTSAGIGGVAFIDLLAGDHNRDLESTVREFALGQPAGDEPRQLKARWSVEGAEGELDQVMTDLDAELILTMEAPDGNYAINWAAVADGEAQSIRRGAIVPLFRPTATPTPTPTPTPLPRPVVAAPSSPQYSAAAPPPGSISIEIGGHVSNTGSGRAVQAMRSAGMTWMKIQSRYYQQGPPDVGPDISAARNNGFKILVGTVGDPAELARGGDAYINGYTNWLQRIAGHGADAIEVWNEPNIDREWPRGQISGVAYARMLAAAYQKIKQANGSTMVISAAPAPTGAENAFPGQVMNDDRWLREMVAGGGLNYLDCVGAHYNEGIIPPSQTSGDPRQGDYYTRYFHGMLNTYYGITRRPICFTELGYLTSEGLPGLPSYFSWAQHVTVQQQAAWLAQAAALASQSGVVRLFIVWNIDFQHYGADPQAGFAIIRPDGSCPACSALAGAR